MRRFSQRNSLVTLNEINITPLLDLAFVLLIIFVITRPLLEQSLPLQLPKGGGPPPKIDPRDVRTVEVSITGKFRLGGREMPLAEIEKKAILHAIEHTKGDRTVAAAMLGIGRTTLYRKLKEYGL